MKRIFIVWLAVMAFLFSASVAESHSSLPAADFRGAVDAAGEFCAVGFDIDYLAVATEKDGKYIRMVTLPDDHARLLFMAVVSGKDPGAAMEAYQDYAWSLPVSYTEEITARPKEQAELDAHAGKTVGELLEEGYELYSHGGGIDFPTLFDLTYGFFEYEFEIDASFDVYLACRDRDDLGSLKVKSGRLSGFSRTAANPDYLADGTYEPPVVPHISAEEAADVRPVPPPEEYTAKAWALTAESYSYLLDNMEDLYGQVYMIEGIVHQVLSRDPLTVIINTGADGQSQPVAVECPAQLSLSLEAGDSCRIYAEVSSAMYILPVLTAGYCFAR